MGAGAPSPDAETGAYLDASNVPEKPGGAMGEPGHRRSRPDLGGVASPRVPSLQWPAPQPRRNGIARPSLHVREESMASENAPACFRCFTQMPHQRREGKDAVFRTCCERADPRL